MRYDAGAIVMPRQYRSARKSLWYGYIESVVSGTLALTVFGLLFVVQGLLIEVGLFAAFWFVLQPFN